MTAPTLWIEITIAGFVWLAATFFLLLAGFGIADLQRLQPPKDTWPYLSAGTVAASYVAGVVAHRIIQLVAPPVFRVLERLLRLRDLTEHEGREGLKVNMAEIWQFGSQRVHREIDFQYALVALLRSLVFSIPFLGLGVVAWVLRTGRSGAWVLSGLDVACWILCFVAYRRQLHQYRTIRTATLEVVHRVGHSSGQMRAGT